MTNTTSEIDDAAATTGEYPALNSKQSVSPLPVISSTAYRTQRKSFIFIVAAQITALLFLAAIHIYTLLTGTELILSTVPVDPWDMFRGSYVRLNYDISRVPCNKNFRAGQRVFVVLCKNADDKWQAVQVSEERPPQARGDVFLSGRVEYSYAGETWVHYGIEQYYVADVVAKQLEQTKPRVLVAVDSFGNAAIKKLLPPG